MAATMAGRRFRAATAVVATAAVSLAVAAAADAQWRPIVQSCASHTPLAGCALPPQFDGAWTVTVSPDGRHAYSAAWDAGAIHVHDRNRTTGALTPRAGAGSCHSQSGSSGCTDAQGIVHPDEIVISPDGRHLYVTSWASFTSSQTVATFDRNPTTGELTQTGCIADDARDGCVDGTGIGGQAALLSPDGRHLYTAGNGTVSVFDRNATDGALTQQSEPLGCFGPTEGCTATNGTPNARQIALSGDGRHLYVPAVNGVLVFNREGTSGALAQKPGVQGCLGQVAAPGCATVPQLGFVENVVLSHDARQLYATHAGGIVTLARNGDGVLSFRGCLNDAGTLGCANGSNVTRLLYGAVSPDGEDVVFNHDAAPGGLTVFRRDRASGLLTRRPGPDGCLSPDGRGFDGGVARPGACRAHPAMGFDGRVRFFGTQHLYAGFYDGDRVVALKRDYLPVCRDSRVSGRQDVAVAVPLGCSDRNGDALRLEVTQPPARGLLGTVDQAAGRVFYDPFGGISGSDSFRFRAVAAGLASNVATASIAIAPRDGDGDGFPAGTAPGTDCDDGDPAINPGVRDVRGNRVDENCDGRAAPFLRVGARPATTWSVLGRRLTLVGLRIRGFARGVKVELRCTGRGCRFRNVRVTGKPRRGVLNALPSLKKRTLRAGQTFEVRIRQRQRIGRVVRYPLKAGKIPSSRELCLPPGARRPARC